MSRSDWVCRTCSVVTIVQLRYFSEVSRGRCCTFLVVVFVVLSFKTGTTVVHCFPHTNEVRLCSLHLLHFEFQSEWFFLTGSTWSAYCSKILHYFLLHAHVHAHACRVTQIEVWSISLNLAPINLSTRLSQDCDNMITMLPQPGDRLVTTLLMD